MTIEVAAERRTQLTAAEIYNSAVAAWAISAAWELGALDELSRHGRLDVEQFAREQDLHPRSTAGMFAALSTVGVVERSGGEVVTGAGFDEVYQTKSFFHWLSRGCSELFTQMPSVLRNANRVGEFYRRDAAAISFACRDINSACFDPAFWTAMSHVDFAFSVVADLGCGSGERLMQMAERYPGIRGLGLDIAPEALAAAAVDAEAHGLTDRLTFGRADVRKLTPRPEYADVELITCFMMGHDFWPRDACVDSLRRLRDVFPRVRRLLLGDATRTVGISDREVPIFTLGFELGHDLMGVYLPTMAEWEGMFPDAGWRLLAQHPVEGLTASVVFELEPSA